MAKQACMYRDANAVRDHAEAAIQRSRQYRLPSWTILDTAMKGWALVEQGQMVEGLALLDEGMETIRTALEIGQRYSDRHWLAEIHRLHGELLRAGGEEGRSAALHFQLALETARQQEARMLELRAATSLARLWRDQGQTQAAQQLLAEVYKHFDEGFDSLDLQEAAALLGELHALVGAGHPGS